MKTSQCPNCSGVAIEQDPISSSTICIGCGLVLEESAIVSDISFLEASNGAQKVSGSYVSATATGHRLIGPGGRSSGMESSEMTKQRSLALLRNYQAAFSLPDDVMSIAERHLILAYEYAFTKGRHIEHVIAVCLFMGCKEKKTSHMLIDFADLLHINVFALGSTYLKWMKALKWDRNIIIEPSVYIARFVALLEFGEDEKKIGQDAVRIAARFKEDWIHEGRRTSGICGAAIYLAAQMNNYRRSIQEIVQVVKIADTTIVKRLEEFSATSSANLTVGDFRVIEKPTGTADPPSFIRARIKEREELEGPGAGRVARRGRKRRRGEMEDDETVREESVLSEPGSIAPNGPLFYPTEEGQAPTDDTPIDPQLLAEDRGEGPSTNSNGDSTALVLANRDAPNGEATRAAADSIDVEQADIDEMNEILASDAGQEALALVRSTTVTRRAQEEANLQTSNAENPETPVVEEDDLGDLDEEELDGYICGEEEARVRERVWTEFNLDYLRKLAAKRLQDQTGEDIRAKKKRKAKKKEPFTPGKTAFESVQAMMQSNKRFSKRINYNVLRGTLTDTMDDKEDDEEDEKLDEKADEYMDGDPMKELQRMRRGGHRDDEQMDYYEQEA